MEGFRNKKIGLQRGRSDLVLYFDSKAIMIEIKTQRGIQSAAQEDWQLAVEIQGFEYFIVRSLREFQIIINKTINGIHTTKANTRLHDKTPLERIKELSAVISVTNDKTVLRNSVELLRIEIARYDKRLFNGKELPF